MIPTKKERVRALQFAIERLELLGASQDLVSAVSAQLAEELQGNMKKNKIPLFYDEPGFGLSFLGKVGAAISNAADGEVQTLRQRVKDLERQRDNAFQAAEDWRKQADVARQRILQLEDDSYCLDRQQALYEAQKAGYAACEADVIAFGEGDIPHDWVNAVTVESIRAGEHRGVATRARVAQAADASVEQIEREMDDAHRQCSEEQLGPPDSRLYLYGVGAREKRYNWTEDPEVCCPKCEHEWHESDSFEMKPGSETECPQCGAVLEMTDTEMTRRWCWSLAKD